MKELKFFTIASIIFLSLNSFSQESYEFRLEAGFNSLNGWMMENPFYEHHLNNRYFVNYLEGCNLDLSKEIFRKDLSVFIGGIVLYKSYSYFGGDQKATEYSIRGGGFYTGIEFFPTLLKFSNTKEHDGLALSSSFAIGNFSFMENIVLVNKSDSFGDPVYAVNEQNNSNGLGAILAIGPKINIGSTSIKLTAKALATGSNDLNVTVAGIAASLGYLF